MASIREAAQNVIGEGRDGIGWIALWKKGRGWETAAFWPDYNERANTLAFESYDMPEIIEILERDPDAIIVNSYVHNLGSVEEMTRDTLANALRWQYDLQTARLAGRLSEGTSYVVLQGNDYIGKTPNMEQAIAAAKARSISTPADAVQIKVKGDTARIRRCRYENGEVRQIWKEQ